MKIVFFITSKKHLDYIKSLKTSELFFQTEILIISDCITDGDVKECDAVVNFEPDKIVLFMAYPKNEVLRLQEYALEKNIPCIGVQEVHQMSLTQSRVNHYFSPLDKLIVNSNHEKNLLSSVATYCIDVKVAGFGFMELNIADSRILSSSKKALLFLSPLAVDDIVSDETFERRKTNIEKTCSMLGKEWTLFIKFHPMDAHNYIDPFLINNGVKILTLNKEEEIENLIDSCEVYFNFGNSQTTFDVLSLKKPICILNESNNLFPRHMIYKKNMDIKDFLLIYNAEDNQLILEEFLVEHLHNAEDKKRILDDFVNEICGVNTTQRDKERFALHVGLLYSINNNIDKTMYLINKFFTKQILKKIIIYFIVSRNYLIYKFLSFYFRKDLLLVYYFGMLVEASRVVKPQEGYIPHFFKRKSIFLKPMFFVSAFKQLSIYKKYKLLKRDFYRFLAPYKKFKTLLPKDFRPRFLVLPVTYRCDLSCCMCTCPQQAKEIGEMEPHQIAVVIQNLGSEIEHVNLTGGELFLRKDIEKIVELLLKSGTKTIGVSSNFFAKHISAFKFLALVEKYPTIRWSIQTSLDGDEEVHNQVRNNKKAFQNTYDTLRLLKSYQSRLKFGLSVNTTISPVNVSSVREIESKLAHIKIPMGYTYAIDSDVYINSDNSKVSHSLHEDEYISSLKRLSKQLFLTKKDLFSLDVFLMLNGYERFSPCSFYYGGYFLEPSGDIYKCSVSKKSYLFNGLTQDLLAKPNIEKVVRDLQEKECHFCMNNCGNALYSSGYRDFYNSSFIRSRTKIYLDTKENDFITINSLRQQGLDVHKYNRESLEKHDLLLYTKFSDFFEKNDDLLHYILIPVGGLSYAL
jgi:MoaA/NifB/PqqE/SkfB family radical SAM enzyme